MTQEMALRDLILNKKGQIYSCRYIGTFVLLFLPELASPLALMLRRS